MSLPCSPVINECSWKKTQIGKEQKQKQYYYFLTEKWNRHLKMSCLLAFSLKSHNEKNVEN